MKPPSISRVAAVLTLLTALTAAPAAARPLITEPTAPLGRYMFEAGISPSYREDTFQAPVKMRYETVNIPVRLSLGLTDRLDVGFILNSLSERLHTPDARYSGSRTALFNPYFKYSPRDYVGFQFIYHRSAGEEGNQELGIARGDDYEVKALFHVPTRVPIEFNFGYVARHPYDTRLGVRAGPQYRVKPSDIGEASVATEFPIRWNVALLTEAAYYIVGKETIGGVNQQKSDGSAADALVGLTWTYGGWSLGTGVAFGLLDEGHSSFDLERGAGDYQLRWMLAYKLRPRKPGQ